MSEAQLLFIALGIATFGMLLTAFWDHLIAPRRDAARRQRSIRS